MYLFYLDESGTHPASKRVVVGGVAVFERAAYWLKKELTETVARVFPDDPQNVPIHAPRLRAKGSRTVPAPYRDIEEQRRRRLLDECYATLLTSRHPVLFATVVDKDTAAGGDSYRIAFEDVVSRFDLMLARFHAANRTQRGIVIMSESSHRQHRMQSADGPDPEGTQWGRTRNLSEVPLHVPKSRTRLLQAASLVTNEIWGRYERGISRHFDDMLPKFDREGTRMHGLTHRTAGVEACWCPACFSYRASSATSFEGGRGDGPPRRPRSGPGHPERSRGDERGPSYRGPHATRDDQRGNVFSRTPDPANGGEDADRQPDSNENRSAPWDT